MLENRRVTALVHEQRALAQPAAAAAAQAIERAPAHHTPGVFVAMWRQRYIVLACLVLGVIAGFVVMKRTTPIYASQAQIHVQQSTPRIISDGLTASFTSQNYLFTQCDVIESTAIVSAAMQAPEAMACKTLASVQNPVGYVKGILSATVGKQSDIITVSVEAPHAEDAALIVNLIVNAYIDYQTKQHRSTAAEVLKILQKEKVRHEEELRKTSSAMLAFRQANGMLAFEGDKGNVIVQRLQELSQAMTEAQLEALNAKVVLDAAESGATDPVVLEELLGKDAVLNGESGNVDQALWAELKRLRRAASDSEAVLGAAHRDVISIKKQLGDMEQQLVEFEQMKAKRLRAAAKQRWLTAQSKEQELRQALEEQRKLAMDLNSKSAEFAQLETDARRAERVLDLLDSRIKEINVTEEAPVSINLLESARPANTPIRPKPSRVFQIALLLALIVGTGAAFAADKLDQRLRSTEEIADALQLPILGVIPHMEGKRLAKDRGQEVHQAPRSNVAEAYRTVRTSIYFGSSDEDVKTLLVTSPAPGDGKTTMASNLAIAMAQAGRRVLLIDADCRRPMQHNVFGIPSTVGLSNVLLKGAAIRDATQSAGIENLFIMPCGPLPHNPAEMLNSQDFVDLIERLAVAFDQIVIDSPPVMPVTDARILAASCDATLLVVRADKSTRKVSAGSVDALAAVGARVLGVVVNDVARSKSGYYYGGYHYNYYGHGNGHDNVGHDDKVNGERRGSSQQQKAIESAT